MATVHNLQQNTILSALPTDDYERLATDLERVALAEGEVLQEPGVKMDHVYFPATCIVSLMSIMENGNTVEIASIGNEGMLGVPPCMNGHTMPNRAVVQRAGQAIRIPEHVITKEIMRIGGRRKGLLHDLLNSYTQRLLNEMTQTAICNQHHKLDQQLCRWLLLRLDRQVSNELEITQELIANNLGVSRNAVSKAAGKLQREGLIHYSRGHLKVLNRVGLEVQTCECYQAVIRLSNQRQVPASQSSNPLNRQFRDQTLSSES